MDRLASKNEPSPPASAIDQKNKRAIARIRLVICIDGQDTSGQARLGVCKTQCMIHVYKIFSQTRKEPMTVAVAITR